jgi:hypothetical protein
MGEVVQGIVLVCSCSTSSVFALLFVFCGAVQCGSGDPWSWPVDWVAVASTSIGNLNASVLRKQQQRRNDFAQTKLLRKGRLLVLSNC